VIEEIERIDNGNPIHDPGKIERPAKSGYADTVNKDGLGGIVKWSTM